MAAGLGTRLRPLTYDLPKPLVPIVNRPVMDHALALLERHGIVDVVANLNYLPELMKAYFGDGSAWGIDLSYSEEPKLLGTAGGVRNARDFLGDGTFVVLSGDGLVSVDLGELGAAHKRNGGVATLALQRVADTRNYGVVILDEDGRVEGFQEKPDPADARSDLGNCGIYIFEPEIFDYFPDADFVDWANDVFPALLVGDVPFYGHQTNAYWNDVGNTAAYKSSNFDALAGHAGVELAGVQREPGLLIDSDCEIGSIQFDGGPVLIGKGSTVGDGVRLAGPLVVGPGSRIGKDSALSASIILPGAQIPAGTVLVDGIAADRSAVVEWLKLGRSK